MGTKVRTCCLLVFLQMLSMIQGQELVKRVPQGFLGMRGKKYYDSEEFDQYIKRKPQFFVGVKGKKNFLDYLRSNYDQYYKRAPMGFIGMRGKKDSFEDSYEYIPKHGSLIGEIDYTASRSYPEESLAFPYLNRLLEEYQKQRNIGDSNEINDNEDFHENNDHATVLTKRAAHMKQFFGVRGKKGQNKRPFDLSFRGKFVGVRGKKDLKNSGYGGMNYLLEQEEPWPKRKGQMSGFFGMRGKKWMDESTAEEAQN